MKKIKGGLKAAINHNPAYFRKTMTKSKQIITKEEAKKRHLIGWNIRCNHCGSYGAAWINKIHGETARPGWGALALCEQHTKELAHVVDQFRREVFKFRQINFEQERY